MIRFASHSLRVLFAEPFTVSVLLVARPPFVPLFNSGHAAEKKPCRAKILSLSSASSSSDDNDSSVGSGNKKRKAAVSRKRRNSTGAAGKAKGAAAKKQGRKVQRHPAMQVKAMELLDAMAASQSDMWSSSAGADYLTSASGLGSSAPSIMATAGWTTEVGGGGGGGGLHHFRSSSAGGEQLGSELLEFSSYDAFQVDGYYTGMPFGGCGGSHRGGLQFGAAVLSPPSAATVGSWQPTSFVPHTSSRSRAVSPAFGGDSEAGTDWGLPVKLEPLDSRHDMLVIPIA
jgi:hypothetical protein